MRALPLDHLVQTPCIAQGYYYTLLLQVSQSLVCSVIQDSLAKELVCNVLVNSLAMVLVDNAIQIAQERCKAIG